MTKIVSLFEVSILKTMHKNFDFKFVRATHESEMTEILWRLVIVGQTKRKCLHCARPHTCR